MSKFKEQLKDHLKEISLKAPRILSIGGQENDKNYFGLVECEEWVVLDNNNDHKPQILHDMNRSIQTEGGLEMADKYIEYFDVVLTLNLWEYIYSPLDCMKNIVDFLKPGGKLISNFPFVYPLHRPEGTDYLRYTPEGVEKLLKMAGLKLVTHDYILGNTLLKTYYQMDGLKARDGFDHQIVGSIIEATKG